MVPRRFFLLFDGSGQRATAPQNIIPTNITRMNQALTYGFERVPQIFHYFSGVGTHGDVSSAITGRGFDDIIIDGYVNIASNYTEGDSIYMFGFSRGAAVALALCHLISQIGILSADQLGHFPHAWRLFFDPPSSEAERWMARKNLGQLIFMRPRVSFLGLFDTVPGYNWDSLGLFTAARIPNTSMPACVDHVVHILCIDDNRNPQFEPLVLDPASNSPSQTLEQIWMPGVHSDIGGSSDGRFLGNISLLTMLSRLEHYCPEVEQDSNEVTSVNEETMAIDKISISDERSGLSSLIGKHSRRISVNPTTFAHPVLDALIGKRLWIRDRLQPYLPNNVPAKLPRL